LEQRCDRRGKVQHVQGSGQFPGDGEALGAADGHLLQHRRGFLGQRHPRDGFGDLAQRQIAQGAGDNAASGRGGVEEHGQ
jgi:hypothetical protein